MRWSVTRLRPSSRSDMLLSIISNRSTASLISS
uniref:Uncharacterized protein n=1 Tax=Arundo donax TaxID=35708 RepID=A0A0A8ZP35_ARUDO